MVYVKAILSGMTAVIATELLTIWWLLRPALSQSATTGVGAIYGVLRESLVYAPSWILAIFLFATFFAASRLDSKALRVVLFWIPTLTISCIGITLVAFHAYFIIRFKNS